LICCEFVVQLATACTHHLSLQQIQTGFTFLVPAHPGSPEQRAVLLFVVVAAVQQIRKKSTTNHHHHHHHHHLFAQREQYKCIDDV